MTLNILQVTEQYKESIINDGIVICTYIKIDGTKIDGIPTSYSEYYPNLQIVSVKQYNFSVDEILTEVSDSYVNKNQLSNYATNVYIDTLLNSYARLNDLTSYVTNTQLGSYATHGYIDTLLNSYVTNTQLGSYATHGYVDILLNSYVTNTELQSYTNSNQTKFDNIENSISELEINITNNKNDLTILDNNLKGLSSSHSDLLLLAGSFSSAISNLLTRVSSIENSMT